MTTTHTPAPASSAQPSTTTGQRVELGDYTTDTGHHRHLVGQRLDGVVHLFDEPDDATERSYLIERGFASNSELRALTDDYLVKARQLGYAPMHGWF